MIVLHGWSLIPLVIAHSLSRKGIEVYGADDVELTLLSFSRRAGIPLLGVCRGAQLWSVASGGSLHPSVSAAYANARYPRHRQAVDGPVHPFYLGVPVPPGAPHPPPPVPPDLPGIGGGGTEATRRLSRVDGRAFGVIQRIPPRLMRLHLGSLSPMDGRQGDHVINADSDTSRRLFFANGSDRRYTDWRVTRLRATSHIIEGRM